MVNHSERLDKAIRIASWAHEQAGQHRKGSDIPYIVHPFGVMLIASQATDEEDILIACLMHDILEDVNADIYSQGQMRKEFGDEVVEIVLDVTKDDSITDWHERSQAYLDHLKNLAGDKALIVSAADKIHNLNSTIYDYKSIGEEVWQRFHTKNSNDQIWWYEEILRVLKSRKAPEQLVNQLEASVILLKSLIESNS